MITLKTFENSHSPFLCNLLKDERVYNMLCAQKYGAYPLTSEDILNYYQANDSLYPLSAFNDCVLAGHILVQKTAYGAHLGSVVLDSKLRGQGLGKSLLTEAINFAIKNLYAKEITIGVFKQNQAALSLYTSLGFTPFKTEQKTILGTPYTYFILRKTIK